MSDTDAEMHKRIGPCWARDSVPASGRSLPLRSEPGPSTPTGEPISPTHPSPLPTRASA